MDPSIERRVHKRFHLRDGSFAGSYPNIGEIIDISLGGILYNYMEFADDTSAEKGEFVICGDDGKCLSNLPNRLVSDRVLANESSFSKIVTRQRRIKFEELTEDQKQILNGFIHNHKAC